MKVWLIIARNGDEMWLIDAWDDDSVSENPEGWRDALAKARADVEPDDLRVVTATLDWDAVRKAFDVAPSVGDMEVTA